MSLENIPENFRQAVVSAQTLPQNTLKLSADLARITSFYNSLDKILNETDVEKRAVLFAEYKATSQAKFCYNFLILEDGGFDNFVKVILFSSLEQAGKFPDLVIISDATSKEVVVSQNAQNGNLQYVSRQAFDRIFIAQFQELLYMKKDLSSGADYFSCLEDFRKLDPMSNEDFKSYLSVIKQGSLGQFISSTNDAIKIGNYSRIIGKLNQESFDVLINMPNPTKPKERMNGYFRVYNNDQSRQLNVIEEINGRKAQVINFEQFKQLYHNAEIGSSMKQHKDFVAEFIAKRQQPPSSVGVEDAKVLARGVMQNLEK